MALPAIGAIVGAAVQVIEVSAGIAAVVAILYWIQDWLGIFPDWLVNLVAAMFEALWDLVRDIFYWIFEQVLDLAIHILNGLDFDFSMFNPAQYISGLPSELVNVIGLIRVGEALAIIVGAIVIRIVLQLIPFTRLGS